jgi:hypothetical protein
MPGTGFTLLIAFAPAPPIVVDAVQEVEVDVSTREAGVFRLRLGISRTALGDWSVLELDLFRPLVPVAIRLLNPMGIPEAVINGYVTRQEVTYAEEPGASVLEVSGMDATHLMNLQEKVMPWPNLPDNAIAAAIFGQYAVVPRVHPTPPLLVEPEGTTTQRGTDIRFLKRLARRNGFDCFVQPEPLSGLDMGFFQPPATGPGVPQAVLNVNMGAETNVLGFNVSYEMTQPTSVVAAGLDAATKAPQPALAPVPLAVPMGLEPALLRILPPPIVRPADTGLMRTSELQTAAQAILAESSLAVRASGTVPGNAGILRPGGIVNVRGAGRVFSGSYYVTRVSHSLSREGGHMQRFEALRDAVGLTGTELFIDV